MRRDRKNGYLGLVWTVAPEHAISPWCIVLRVGFKNFTVFVEWVFKDRKNVGIQGGVSGIGLQIRQRLLYLLNQSNFRWGCFQLLDFGKRFRCMEKLEDHLSSLRYLE